MREFVRLHVAAGHALQPVVPDRGGGVQSFFRVAGVELDLAARRAAGLRRRVSPHAREAVRLQLDRTDGPVMPSRRCT